MKELLKNFKLKIFFTLLKDDKNILQRDLKTHYLVIQYFHPESQEQLQEFVEFLSASPEQVLEKSSKFFTKKISITEGMK